MARVLVPLAEGFEELEAITVVDLLRRAEIEVVTAGLVDGPVVASRRTVVVPDVSLASVVDDPFDMVVLPGGQPGANHLNEDSRIHDVLRRLAESGAFVAAICAAPLVLAHAGLLDGKQVTAFPGTLEPLNQGAFTIVSASVVQDERVITSRGPGTALDFALTLIEILTDRKTRSAVEEKLQRPDWNWTA